MSIKIKSVLQNGSPNGVLCTSWLEKQNITRAEQTQYVRSGWLVRIVPGIYHLANAKPTLYGTLASMDEQEGLHYRIAASSALELQGYTHYLSFGQRQAHIITPSDKRLPKWIASYKWDMSVHEFSTKIFGGTTGVATIEQDGMTVRVSSPELAVMECLHLVPETYSLMDVYYLLESLTALRASSVTQLLEQCRSVKVKRLFLYMAEKANHPWFKRLDLSNVTLGSGPRSFAKGGVSIAKYNIIIPKELADYE